jgi:hypothetical protein
MSGNHDHLSPATAEDVADALAFALRWKRIHNADELNVGDRRQAPRRASVTFALRGQEEAADRRRSRTRPRFRGLNMRTIRAAPFGLLLCSAAVACTQEMHFSPEEDLATIDARLIVQAKHSIDFASYTLTDACGPAGARRCGRTRRHRPYRA